MSLTLYTLEYLFVHYYCKQLLTRIYIYVVLHLSILHIYMV